MPQKSYKVNPVTKRNEGIAKVLCLYIKGCNDERVLRTLWDFSKAIFTGYNQGYLVDIEKAKAYRKQALGLALTQRDNFILQGYTILPTNEDAPIVHVDQDNMDAFEMEYFVGDTGLPGEPEPKGELQ